jgi:UDP-N-acetyl-D-glucosamine dehydrogenase
MLMMIVSSSYRLIQKLEDKGAKDDYNDPHVPKVRLTREFPQDAGRKSQ